MIRNGHHIELTRRRYGRTTYTWIYVKLGDTLQSTGDPLPKIMPSRSDIAEAVERAYRYRNSDEADKAN